MKNCAPERIRNFVVVGHAGAGKTALADLMLFKAGAVSRQGSIDNGTSVSDFRKEEQDRKSSIDSAILNCAWKDGHFFFVDTPGGTDFCGEALNAINAADLMVLVVDATAGVGPGTLRAWRMARDLHLPRMVFINGLDRDNADYEGVLDTLRQSLLKNAAVPMTKPVGAKASLSAVTSVLSGGDEEAHAELVEAVASSDDELMEKYMESETLSDEDLLHGLRKALLTENLIPVFAGSVAKDIGVAEMMDFILDYGPAPTDDVPVKLASGTLDRKGTAAVGYVFKSVNDTFIGQLSYIRILSGTLKKDLDLTNTTNQNKERLGNLLLIQGKGQEPVDEAGPGEIIAVDNGDPTSHVPFYSTEMPAFHGRCAVIVRRTGPGPITVTVSGRGLKSAKITLNQ